MLINLYQNSCLINTIFEYLKNNSGKIIMHFRSHFWNLFHLVLVMDISESFELYLKVVDLSTKLTKVKSFKQLMVEFKFETAAKNMTNVLNLYLSKTK